MKDLREEFQSTHSTLKTLPIKRNPHGPNEYDKTEHN